MLDMGGEFKDKNKFNCYKKAKHFQSDSKHVILKKLVIQKKLLSS